MHTFWSALVICCEHVNTQLLTCRLSTHTPDISTPMVRQHCQTIIKDTLHHCCHGFHLLRYPQDLLSAKAIAMLWRIAVATNFFFARGK
jgi:hypothetical protein